ncbi:unnamed protein product [Penicillium viridicatum]
MPPKPSPHKLRVPILRKHTWCMTCLHVSVKDWDEESMAAFRPFVMKYHAATYNSKNYLHCNHLHKVPEGLEGNRYELLSVLSWAEQFWTNSDDGFGIDPDDDSVVFSLGYSLVIAVAAALRHLVASFDNFVKSHCRAHSFTGTNVAQETKDTYAQWVANRVPLLARPVSVPDTAPEWEKLAGEVPSTQHLRVMEESVRSWYTGILAFRQDVEELVAEAEALRLRCDMRRVQPTCIFMEERLDMLVVLGGEEVGRVLEKAKGQEQLLALSIAASGSRITIHFPTKTGDLQATGTGC